MQTSTILNPDLAATANHYQNREFGTMSVTDQLNREICRLREENERFKVMYKGFENQALVIMRYREALETALECLENNGFGKAYAIDVAKQAIQYGEVKQ